MIKNSVIDTIEKVFRYFIPGIMFFFLYNLSFPSAPPFIIDEIGNVIYILIPSLGMVIYGIHRILLSSTVELILYCYGTTAVSNFSTNSKVGDYPSALAGFLRVRHKQNNNENLSGYLFYRWAILHYSLILSELVFFFIFFHDSNSVMEIHRKGIIIATSIFFGMSLIQACIYYAAEKHIFQKE